MISKVCVMIKVHINMCPVWNGYGVRPFETEQKGRIIENVWNKITKFYLINFMSEFNVMK